RSPAPWVTIAVGALALAPHVAWLIANGFEPFSYAVLVHGGTSVMSALGAAIGYLAGSVGYVAVAVVIAVLATRPSAAAVRDSLWCAETTAQPLRLFRSYEDFSYGAAFYLPSRPLTVNAPDGVPPPGLDARIALDGIVLVCPAQAQGCVNVANARAARGP